MSVTSEAQNGEGGKGRGERSEMNEREMEEE